MGGKKTERQRYLLVRYFSRQTLQDKEIWQVISKQIIILYGEKGSASLGLYLVKHDPEKQEFIMRASSDNNCAPLRASIASIKRVKNQPALFFTSRVSGTISGLGES